MIVYRDRIYCAALCANSKCIRCVTPEIEADAKRVDLPIAYANLLCGDFIPKRLEAKENGDE
jgi:hypothetical protein